MGDKYFLIIITIIISITFSVIVFPQQYADISIEQLLSEKQQKEIGLQKLNSQEKEALRKLLLQIFLLAFEKGKEEGLKLATDFFSKQNLTSDVIESQIDGEFEGWEGETVIKLTNGQIWQQTEYYYYYYYSFMPNVLIYKSGSEYKMKVEGVEKAVGVIRLK